MQVQVRYGWTGATLAGMRGEVLLQHSFTGSSSR